MRDHYKHPEVVERGFRRDILPAIGRATPKDVTCAHLTKLLAQITASGRPTIANDTLRYLRMLFAYGEALGLVETNPALGLTSPDAGGKEKARNRALTQDELPARVLA